jgi:hypothetical protein
MRGLASIQALATVAACGGSTAPVRPSVDPAEAVPDVFPPQPPMARPGERCVYRLSVHEVDVATYTVVAGEETEIGGTRVVVVQAGVESSPLISMVRHVDDNFTSWIDAETSRSVLFRVEELAAPDDDSIEHVDAEAGRVEDGRFAIRVRRGNGDEEVEHQAVGDVPVFDMNGFLIVLRSWQPPLGTVGVADVIRSRWMWRTTVRFVRTEEFTTALGTLPAVYFEGEARRLTRDGEINSAIGPRQYRLWISDDADRVPLRFVAVTDYGDVVMDLIEYVPAR